MGALVVLGAAGSLWVMWVAATGETLEAVFTGFLPMAVVAVLWLVVAVIGGANYRMYWPSAAVPVLFVTTLAVLWLGVPHKAGWLLSRSALDRAAADCVESDDSTRIGVYEFSRVTRIPGGCQFHLEDPGMLSRDGFAHLPNGPAGVSTAKKASYSYSPHDGQWYEYDLIIDYTD